MPATQNFRLSDWREPPFLTGVHEYADAPDGRVFNFNDVEDVATCLLETSDEIAVYRWVLTDSQLEQLALESAKSIIQTRNQTMLEHQLDQRFLRARQSKEIEPNGQKLAVVVSLVQDLATGESVFNDKQVPVSRIRA